MRKLVSLTLFLAVACSTASVPPPATPPQPAEAHGLTVEEEAQILALEDRRQYDAAYFAAWAAHPNALHRLRIAMALSRIGAHNRVDTDGDGRWTAGTDYQAGLTELTALSTDSDRRVREAAVFALGEIGDVHGAEPLFQAAVASDAGVAAEAVEALSKLLALKELPAANIDRYLALTGDSIPEGVRLRAIRYLFRVPDERGLDVALNLLASPLPAIRQEAAYTLSRRAFAKARPALELLVTDPATLTRAYAVAALGRIAEEPSLPIMIAALSDPHPWVRTNAAIAIGKIAQKSQAALRSADVPRVVAILDDPDPGSRASIIDALGYYAAVNETARHRLLDLMHSGSQWERELAAGAIARNFDSSSEAYAALQELTPWQQVRVLEATSDRPHGVQLRKERFASPDPLVRAAALGAIPDTSVDAESELVVAGLSDPDVVVRTIAIDRYSLLTTLPPEERLAVLQPLESRERATAMNDARLAALQAIARIEFEGRDAYLAAFVGDRDPVIRRVSAELLAGTAGGAAPYAPFHVARSAAEYEEIARWAREPHTATIHMTRGRIELALLAHDAPMTAWNFAQLAAKKFFDGTTFMRVVPNFVIQGGDPRNDMNGGPGYAIRDEINLQKYTRGAVGMALSGPDTGGSQFFITHSPQPHLDGGYTIFGRVYDGMSGVVDQTERGDRVETIVIDEHAPVGQSELDSVPNVSLPLEVGAFTLERLLERVPDYDSRMKAYEPDQTVLEMMKSYVHEGDHIDVFMGTWCHDSQREVPKLLRIVTDLKAHGVELPVRFLAIDRSKHEPAALLEGKTIDKVATFIYYRGERELGRISERPTGVFEDDLLSIAAAGQ